MKTSSPCLMVLLLALASARILENRPDRNLVPPVQQANSATSLKNNQSGPSPLADHNHALEPTSNLSLDKNRAGKENRNTKAAKQHQPRKNVKVDKRSAHSQEKTSHYVFSPKKGLKKESKQRKLVSASSKHKPERKLYYVLNKSQQKTNSAAKAPLSKDQKKSTTHPAINRQLNQKAPKLKSAAQPKKLEQKPQVKVTPKPVTPKKTPELSLKKSFVVSKQAVQRVRKLVEGDQDGERKLQSIPLLLFGDYEIIIEKK